MKEAFELIQNMVKMVNQARQNGQFEVANEHFNILCGAMCVFNAYEKANNRTVTLGEVNNQIFIKLVEA